jgi:tRNA dimethylallyltransferase
VEITNYLTANPDTVYEPKPVNSIIFALKLERRLILERIIIRLKYRLEHGLIEEIENLLKMGLKPEQLLYYGLEYRWVTMYVLKEMTYDQMFDRLNISIRQFAKRQMTWFRRMEKNGYRINWLDGDLGTKELTNKVVDSLAKHTMP